MTEQTQPTDAEILDAADDFRSQYKRGGTTFDEFDALGFARAVLAKWGTPTGAGAPYGYLFTAQEATIVGDERKSMREVFTRKKPPCASVALYTTPQPTQAQAGAVPVGFRLVPIEPTVEILQAMDRAFSDAMHVGVPVSPEAYAAMIKAVDAADIKGADHGITAHGAARKQGAKHD